MGATASSAQRDSRCEEDAAAEELTAAASDARDDGSADDKLLQKNGQISNLNVKTRNHADQINGQVEERVLADVGSGFVTLKEDGTDTIEDLQDADALQQNIKNESSEMVNAEVTVKEETEVEDQVNDINEVGFKKIFRFVGFKFTLKKDTCEKTEASEQEERIVSATEDSSDTQENSAVAATENTPDETEKSEVSSQPDAAKPSQQMDNEGEPDQEIKIVEHHVEDTPDKEIEKETSPEPEEPMSPIKQFFTQGIFASLRKKKKEEEIQKEIKEEELKGIEKIGIEEPEKEDSKCMCLDIPYITSEEEKNSPEKSDDKLLPEAEIQNSLEKDKVQGSPLKRLFRKFSTRRQRESKTAEKMIEAEEQVSEQPKPSSELTELGKPEEPVVEEPKPAEEELVADVSPQETKKKSDTTVSWEALICGGSAKKRARKTNDDEMPDKGQEFERTTDSPLGSSIEGDYDHLTSSNEQTGSPAEGEMGSTWKTFKKMVTPKRKVRSGESSTPEQIPSDSEMNKDESFSMKKLIPGHKKRKSDARQDLTSSDEATKEEETGDEDDETPAIIPLSEYEIIEPESVKDMNEQQVEITIEHGMAEMTSQVLKPDTSIDLVPKIVAKVSSNTGPTVIHPLPEDFEELTDFVSKHQQLSDIPEEGIIEESVETPVSSAEWTTQDDTLAEDIVELTADAVTAPEPESEQLIGDDTTEMVSAVSQLTESPRTSGHITPVPAEYSIQTSDAILQEAIQSICMIPSVQSVSTKDETKESLAVSFSPYIVHSTASEETKVLVAHKKTEATAICTGLVSQELESVQEHLPAPLVEGIPEVSDAIPTEIVSDNFTDEPEVAGLVTDEVYEAEMKVVKTEYQEIIMNEEESATESERDIEQVIQLLAEPFVEESGGAYMEDKMECGTRIELIQDNDPMQSETGLDQVVSDYIHGPEKECPLYSALEETPYEQSVAAEKELKLPDVELSAVEFEQSAHPEVVKLETVDNIPDTTTHKASDVPEEDIEIIASPVECLETKEPVSTMRPVSDDIKEAAMEVEDSLQMEVVHSIHVDVCEIQVDVKDKVLLAGDSAATIEDMNEKKEEKVDGKIAHQEIKEMHLEEDIGDVSSKGIQHIEAENISVDDSAKELPAKEVLLPTLILVEEAGEVHKEIIDTDVDDKVDAGANNTTDRICVIEEKELALKEAQLVNIEANETENQDESAQLTITDESSVDAGNKNGVQEIREHTVVPEFSKDIFEHTEAPAVAEASCEVILTPLETALPDIEARPVPTEIVASQTEEWSQDIKQPDLPKQNEQPVTTENIKTGKVLEMVAIIENTTKESGTEKPIVAKPVAQEIAISELPKAMEQEGDASEMTLAQAETIDGDQTPAITSTDIRETAVHDEKDITAVTSELESEKFDTGSTVTGAQKEVSNVSEDNHEADEAIKLKCEPLEQLIEMSPSNELQVDKEEIKDEIPAVIEEEPEVTVSEIQKQVLSEHWAATLEVTELKVEMPVVTDVQVEKAVVTELEVETPVVTSVVTELEVETPVVTCIPKTTDTQSSAVMLQNQDIDIDTLVFTAVIKEQVVEKPTFIPVEVTPGIPLDDATPVLTQSNELRDVAYVEGTPAVTIATETLNVDSVSVRTAVAPVVEIQSVIPEITLPDLGSVTVTEAASPEEAQVAIVSTVVETPVVIAEIAAVVEKTTVSPVVEIPVIHTPDVGPVKSVPSKEISVDVIPFAEGPVTKVIETPVISITSVKPAVATVMQTPISEIPAMISGNREMTVTEAVSPVVVTPAVTPVASEAIVIPVVDTPEVTSTVVPESIPLTPVVETPTQVSVTVTEAEPSVITPAETSAVLPVVETPVVNPSPGVMVETPVVTSVQQTPCQVSVRVTETLPQAVVSAVTAAVKTHAVISVVETPDVKTSPVAVVETPVMSPVVQIPGQVSVETSTVETPAMIPTVETPVVKSTPVVVDETPVVTPVVEIPCQVSQRVTETSLPVVVSAVTAAIETPAMIPVVKTPVVESTPAAVVEISAVTPVVQTPCQVLQRVTQAAPPVVVSAVTAAIETPAMISVVKTPVVESTPAAVVEISAVTPVVQTPCQVLQRVTQAAPPVVVSAVTAAVETLTMIPVVETPVVKSTPVAVVETPAVTSVVQTTCQVSQRVTEAASPEVVSALIGAVETPDVIPVVETPVVKSTPAAVVETPAVAPVVQTPDQVPVMVKETVPTVVVSSVTAAVEKPAVIPVIETPVAKSIIGAVVETPVVTPVLQTPEPSSVAVVDTPLVTPVLQTPEPSSVAVVDTPLVTPVLQTPEPSLVAVVDTPLVTPVLQIPGQVSVIVNETAPPAVASPVTSVIETPPTIPVVEIPVVTSTPPAVVETPVVAPAVQTPGQVSVRATETSPPVVVATVTAAVETLSMTPVVETPLIQSTPVSVVQTPHQVLVTITEAAPSVVVSAVSPAAETPVVIPVMETPVAQLETPAVTPVMMTPTVAPIVERSVVSLVLETTVKVPTSTAVAERPFMIPVVQTPAIVSVMVKEAPPPAVQPAVTAAAETSVVSTKVETLAVKPTVAAAETAVPVVPVQEAPVVTPTLQTLAVEQVTQTPSLAVSLVKAAPVVTMMEEETETPALSPVIVTPVMAPVVGAAGSALLEMTPEIKEAIFQVIEQEREEAESSFVFEDVETPLTEETEPVVTSTEPQSEVEEDVWEDAVDNIGDSQCPVTQTEGSPQGTAAKQASGAAI